MKTPAKLPFWTINAFVDEAPFSGNPAAVCLVPAGAVLEPVLMQAIAAQHNLSETAFVCPVETGGWNLRWFTPACEVKLCGHATLAAARALGEAGVAERTIAFHSRSGELRVERAMGEDDRSWMDFPSSPVEPTPLPKVLDGVFPEVVQVGQNDLRYLVVELPDAKAVEGFVPDMSTLRQVDAFAIVITAPGEGEVDFVSRFFAPRAGVPEDPFTGSAHASLFPFWAAKLGRSTLAARQLSARRGLAWTRPAESGRVWLGGRTEVFARGTIDLGRATRPRA